MELTVIRADGILTVQDMGRPGHLAQGLSRGGAMDRMAVIEAAALLNAPAPLAGIEMAGAGGLFGVSRPTRVALTGAPSAATLDGAALAWHACHLIAPGQVLKIGGCIEGSYGYLTPAGGIAGDAWLGSRAAHLSIGIGAPLVSGQQIPCADDPAPAEPAMTIARLRNFDGGLLRVMDGAQTDLFSAATRARFHAATFVRAPQGNRQGVRLDSDALFSAEGASGLASDLIGPGDVQMTGDGVPYVLLAECQTMGGYPRIGTVIPADLPRIAQAPAGSRLRFQRIGLEEAEALTLPDATLLARARRNCCRLIRDPATVNLMDHQLIGGVTAGRDLEDR